MHINFSLSQTKRECRLHFYRVEDGEETWDCRLHYQNSDGETILFTPKNSKNEMERMIFKEKSNQRKSISNNSSQNNVAMNKKMPSVDKLSNKNSTPDHNSSRPAYSDKSSMKVSSMDKLPTKNATEAPTNCM